MTKHLFQNNIQEAARRFETVQDKLAVLLVLNIKGSTHLAEDYNEHSAATEFFSLQEAEEFISGFQQLGIYHEVYNGETEFIEKLASGYIARLPYQYKVVYSSTGVGLARSKSALVPALCHFYGLRYCSNDIYTAAFLENKVHVMNLLEYYGFPLPEYWVYDADSGWLNGKEPKPGMKLIAKPAYECASTGITDKSVSEYHGGYMQHIRHVAETYRQPVIVEAFIEGYEVEVPVFDLDEPFCPMAVGIEEKGQRLLGPSFLTYEKVADDKYQFYNFEEELPDVAEQLKQTAIRTFKTLNLTGVLRVDFRIKPDGTFYIMDYNNSPHLTPNHSCAFSIIRQHGTFDDMLKLVLYKAIADDHRVPEGAVNRHVFQNKSH